MNRKQKAMEEKHVQQSSKGPRVRDHRTWASMAEILSEMRFYRRVGFDESELRDYLNRQYKNGTKLYDQAVHIETSPLMQALS